MHYRPTPQDILSSLPPSEQAELLALIGKAGVEEAAETGPRWIAVPDTVWTAFTAKVKRGDYDRR